MVLLRQPGDPCVVYAAEKHKRLRDFPPGSSKARKGGCTCPVEDNNYGRGLLPGCFWLFDDCPIHNRIAKRGTIEAIID